VGDSASAHTYNPFVRTPEPSEGEGDADEPEEKEPEVDEVDQTQQDEEYDRRFYLMEEGGVVDESHDPFLGDASKFAESEAELERTRATGENTYKGLTARKASLMDDQVGGVGVVWWV
jgi:hypothetical protein